MGGFKNLSGGLFIFGLGTAPALLWEGDFLLWEASKTSSGGLFNFGLETAPVYYGREDLLLWEASKTFQNSFSFLAWKQHQFIMGGGFFIMGGLKNLFRIPLHFWPGNSTSLLWEGDFLLWETSKTFQNPFAFLAWEQHQIIMGGGFFIMGGLQNLFWRTFHFWPGNSTSLLWEGDFLLWEASKTFHNHFGLLAWEQNQLIMERGFFIMGGLKNSSEGLCIFGLGTAPLYYGREDFFIMGGFKNFSQLLCIIGLGTTPAYYGKRIFHYGRPEKIFRRTLHFCPGNSTSLLWEKDFLRLG